MCFTVLHDTMTAAHLGSQKTLEKIKQRFYWYECRDDVEYWCRTCDICASRKPPHRRAKAPMKQYSVGYPLESIAIDCLGPLPSSNNARYLLVVACYFTKWLQVIPLEGIDAKTVATKLIERFISVFGVPVTLHTDQGSNFGQHRIDHRVMVWWNGPAEVFKQCCQPMSVRTKRTGQLICLC